jgi:hypothetical protein
MQVVASREEAKQVWLDDEWGPQLQRHRERLRAERLAKQQSENEDRQIREQAFQRETEAMAREDAASSSFAESARAECQRRSSAAALQDIMAQTAVQEILAARLDQLCQERELELRRLQAEEDARRNEAERRERDYKAWKSEVRNARYRQSHNSQHQIVPSEAGEEELQKKRVLEDALHRATLDALRLHEKGLSVRSCLDDARSLATSEKKTRDQMEPARAEQELWESMLAKNRRARQQERSSRTPRWGII